MHFVKKNTFLKLCASVRHYLLCLNKLTSCETKRRLTKNAPRLAHNMTFLQVWKNEMLGKISVVHLVLTEKFIRNHNIGHSGLGSCEVPPQFQLALI